MCGSILIGARAAEIARGLNAPQPTVPVSVAQPPVTLPKDILVHARKLPEEEVAGAISAEIQRYRDMTREWAALTEWHPLYGTDLATYSRLSLVI